MNHKLTVLISLFCLNAVTNVLGQDKATAPNSVVDRTRLTIDRIFSSNEFDERGMGALVWSKLSDSYFILDRSADGKGQDLVQVDIASGTRKIILEAKDFVPDGREEPVAIESYTFSEDESQLLVYTNSRRVWRRNSRGDYWLLNRATKKIQQLGGEGEEASMMFAKFSPDGHQIAFVRKNNIFVQDTRSLAIQPLTSDGSATTINGTSDWVYEEELDLRDAFRWSPDSQSIAYWQLDTTGVREFNLINNTDDTYSRTIPIAYPKVGEQNAAARVGVVSIRGGDTRWLDIPGDPRNNYIAQMEWTPKSDSVAAQQFNRIQNRNTVFLVDAKSGKAHPVHTEETETWLENENPFRWLDGGGAFLWISEQSGWRSAYRASLDGKQPDKRILADDFDLIAVEAVDDKEGFLYLSASPQNATQRYLYRVRLDGGKAERLTPEGQPGWHSYNISPSRKWAVHTYSSFSMPPRIEIIQLEGHKPIRVVADNQGLRDNLAKLELPKSEFVKLDIGEDVILDAWVLLPPKLESGKKYPLFLHVYGEPHGQTVKDSWGGKQGLWHQMLAQQGYIVASIDNRGTMSPRGRDWRKIVHRQIGILASADQSRAATALQQKFPAIDSDRIGIWGWSGGGSMSLNAIFRYPQQYHLAMAVAPVPNQLLYDTIYQERYMGLPSDNAEGYRLGSPITFAKQLEGKLLLVHGTGDDNCHYQGVELLMNELIKHNKHFSVMPYPNRTHSIREGANTTRHLYGLMAKFLEENMPPVAKPE
jgi:dipeptidyl-peptidase 4